MRHIPLPFSLGWSNCTNCDLCKRRTNVVHGVGKHNAEMYFLGPYPGPDEDKIGLPFVGAAGEALDLELYHKNVDISRDDIFIDNCVACWPTKDENGKVVTGKPTLSQIQACMWRVWESIYRIDPILIVALGKEALKALTGELANITSARGDVYMAKVPGFYKHVTYPVFATFNPEYIADNKQNRKGTPRQLFRQDLSDAKLLVEVLKKHYKGE